MLAQKIALETDSSQERAYHLASSFIYGSIRATSGSRQTSLLPTIMALWKGRGPWKLAALVMSLVSFFVS
jgi:hypothetical protein